MANRKLPPIPTIVTGGMLGVVLALLFQRPAILALPGADPNLFLALVKGVWTTFFDGFVLQSGNATLDDLMSRGGMISMLNTIWLILCAMIFGASMERVGLLQRLVDYALSFVHSTGSLIATTIVTCIGANVITSDQYISIVLPGRMYKLEYQSRDLDVKNLSRTLEDSGTITSPLVPWNTCGAYMSGTPRRRHARLFPVLFFQHDLSADRHDLRIFEFQDRPPRSKREPPEIGAATTDCAGSVPPGTGSCTKNPRCRNGGVCGRSD